MTKILIILTVFSNIAHAQWKVMQKYEEFGQGTFYTFVPRDVDAKRIILETLNDNQLSYDVMFTKGSNLLTTISIVDPLNSEFVYIIHSMRSTRYNKPGYNIICYHMENRYRYFYDITENDGRISVIYDPAISIPKR
jgi:hypothetical protein